MGHGSSLGAQEEHGLFEEMKLNLAKAWAMQLDPYLKITNKYYDPTLGQHVGKTEGGRHEATDKLHSN